MIKVLFGKRGKGKTYYLKQLIKKSVLPVLIYDVLSEYGEEAVAVKVPAGAFEPEYFKSRIIIADRTDFDLVSEALVRRAGTEKPALNVIIDEVDFYTSSQLLPEAFAKVLKFSRHLGINLYLAVRNPVECNRKISGLADSFIIFNLTEPRYLDYFKQYNESLPALIKSIPKYHYIEYDLTS